MTEAIGSAARSNAVTADASTSDWDADQYLKFEVDASPRFSQRHARHQVGRWAGKLSATSVTEEGLGTIDHYYASLQGTGCTFDVWETTDLHPLAGLKAVVEWFKGSELRPYLHLLADEERQEFLDRYRAEIAKAYPAQEDGKVLLRPQRVFIVVTRSQTRKSFAPWFLDPGPGHRKVRVVELET
jgi:trans-aconitate 2-methyltransferase